MIKSLLKKIATSGMVLMLLSTSLLSSASSVVYANEGNKVSSERATKSGGTSSNDRVSTYINFAAGKKLDASILKNLNTTQLRFMGVFLSNFYTPWMTDLGNSSDESSQTAQSHMAKALTEYVSFDETTAKTFSSYLQGISRASFEELKVKFGKEDGMKEGFKNPDGSLNGLTATYADLLMLASGSLNNAKESIVGKKASENVQKYVGSGLGEGDYRYAYFGFGDGDNFKPVLSFDTTGETNTASYVAFLKALEMVDTSKGYGFAALDFKDSEFDVTLDSFKKLVEKKSREELAESSIFGAKLGVDAFGNIIWFGKNHQYIILPGAMNPYTWQQIDGNGNDYGGVGSAYNLANAQSIAHINNNSLGSVSSSSSKGTYSLSPANNTVFNVGDSKGNLLPNVPYPRSRLYDLRMVIGSSVITSEGNWNKITDLWSDSSQDSVMKAIKEDFIDKRFGAKASGTFGSDSIQLTADEVRMPAPYYGSGSVPVMGGLAMIDNKGAHGSNSDSGDSSKDSFGSTPGGAYKAIQKGSLINESGNGFVADFGKVKISDTKWGNSYKKTEKQGYAKLDSAGTAKEVWQYLYATYAVAGIEDGKLAGGDNIGYRINYKSGAENLPKITGESIKVSDQDAEDGITKSIRDWLYYLLHPTDGFLYFVTWITNKLNAFVLSWHNDMAGTSGVGVLPGTSRYIGFSGYVTTPELTDMQWTDAMLKWYQSIIVYLVIGFFVIMMSYTLLGVLTIQKAILGLVLFSLMSYVPIVATTAAVNLSNRFANWVFGNKFAYWGIVQQQAYFADLADSIDSNNSSYRNYLASLYRENAKESRNQGGDNMVLRWQAPKKMANLVLSKDEEKQYSDDFLNVIKVITNGKSSGESFSDNTSATYMYRSYTDLANVSMFMYGDFVSNGKTRDGVSTSVTSANTGTWSEGLKGSWTNFGRTYLSDRKNGYSVNDGGGSNDGSQAYRIKLPLSGKIYSDAADVAKQGTIKDLKLGQYVGLDQRFFKFSIAQLNTNSNLISELSRDGFDASVGGKYTNSDVKSLAAYGVMSENPFYYFSWGLYDQGLASNPNKKEGFRDLLLSKSDSGYFYNAEHNNEMRDYMDFRSMFTYLIPFLKQGNDLVREWDKTYGIFFYDGVTYEEGHEKDPEIANNPEMAQKYWHNVNVARLYNIYTPWVDLMYDTSYAKPERISFQGQSYTVEDPINPASYPSERPMVFSKAEMYDYGLSEDQLTTVERKIMKVSEKTMARWFDLLNYYTFTDVALNTSAAMEANFIFNQEFSDTRIVGKSVNLYPQSFELKNFTYDAFLRMIVASSTGESLVADEGENGSVYERVMKNSSLTTGISLLVLDVLAIYAIPLIKIVTIIALFVSAILVVIVASLSVDDSIGKSTLKKVVKAVTIPAFGFFGVSVGMSWIVSKFMGGGNKSVTGITSSTVVLGDPTMTILAMMLINVVVFILYWKVLRSVWGALKKHGGTLFSHIGGVLGGAALTGAAMLGLGGKLAQKATQGVISGTKSIASGTAKAASAVDGRLGITNKGSQRAQRRAEEKARLRQDRLDFRQAKHNQRERMREGGGFSTWLNRHKNISQDMHDARRERNVKHNMGVDAKARQEYHDEKRKSSERISS